jgi:hypothetical protein
MANGGKLVSNEDVARARQQGATDKEIQDTVLIAAAFCMAPTDPQLYRENGKHLVEDGYVQTTASLLARAEK